MTNADAVLRSRGGVLLVACVLVAVVAAPAVAQSATQQPVLDGIAAQYRDAARLWRPRLLPVAQQLFLVLAGIEFAVSGGLWALRRDSLDDIAAKFLLKFTLVAFLLALITSFTTWIPPIVNGRSEEHTSELQSRLHLVCRLLLEKKKKTKHINTHNYRPSQV